MIGGAIYRVKITELNISSYDEFNIDVKDLFNRDDFQIGSKNINKKYILDNSFNGVYKPTKKIFFDIYSQYDLNDILYYAVQPTMYNMELEDTGINRRIFESTNRRTINIAKRRVINRMYSKYKPVIKEEYVDKLEKNIKSKLNTFVKSIVRRNEYRKFKRHLTTSQLILNIVDVTDNTIELSILLQPLFTPTIPSRIRSNISERLDFGDEQTGREELETRLNELRGLNTFQPDEEFRDLNTIDEILNTQEVTQNGPNLDDAEFAELEQRFLRLQSNTPIETPLNIAPEQNVYDLEDRMQQIMRAEDVEMLGTSDLEQMPTSDSVQAEFDALMNDEVAETEDAAAVTQLDALMNDEETELEELERELEELASGNIDGGGNTQSKMTLFDDLDSDDELPRLDSDDSFQDDIEDYNMPQIVAQRSVQTNRTNYLHDLELDEMTNLLKSIKINNGCDDIIRFCQVSNQVATDCKTIPEIRDNVYMPCVAESMIIKINNVQIDMLDIPYKNSVTNFYDSPNGENLNRKKILDYERQTRGSAEDYLNKNLECNDRFKKQLLHIINESLKQIPMFTNDISEIPLSFVKYMIIMIKDSLERINKFDWTDGSMDGQLKRIVKYGTEPLLEYQLAKFLELENRGVLKHEIYNCFIKYLRLLLNYEIDDILSMSEIEF